MDKHTTIWRKEKEPTDVSPFSSVPYFELC